MTARIISGAVIPFLLLTAAGCQSPAKQLKQTDRVAAAIIEAKQVAALGRTEPFSIEPPAELLRRRLLLGQNLPKAGPASLGSQFLERPEGWPAERAPQETVVAPWVAEQPLALPLLDALQIAARNSRDYQQAKEEVFRSALALDLERDLFRRTFAGTLDSEISSDRSGVQTVTGVENRAAASFRRRLQTGAAVVAQIGIDLVKLLTLGGASSLGLFADASISIPLLRGAGRHVVTEPLTQAERNTLYAIWNFERFKRSFAVAVASEYLAVLQQLDRVQNAEENYRSLTASARRAERLAEAGRLSRIQVGQALQDELRARERRIGEQQESDRLLDGFKILIGLPPDARIELDRDELARLAAGRGQSLTADTESEGAPSTLEAAGPYELEPRRATRLGLDHRLDLRIAQGRVDDAQRGVVVAADALRAELNLLGSATAGEARSLASAGSADAKLRPARGVYAALLSLDLPLERSVERTALRNSYIDLEQRVRDLQQLEDQVKLDIRNRLRDLLESRVGFQIQAQSVQVARQRVDSTELFLRAGRGQIRDLLEAQDALTASRNALSSALVSYRVAELELQRDMGLLQVNEQGLWQEYRPEDDSHAEN